MKKQLLTLFTVISLCSLFLAPFSVQAQIPNYVPTNGLVGWWPFNGNANDESGNGNNGTVNGATLTADRFGNANKAYSFDGVSNYIEVLSSSSLTVTNSYSICVWLKSDIWSFQAPIDQHSIVSKIEDGDWYGGYEIRSGGMNGNIMHSGNIGSNLDIGSGGYSVSTWYFAVVSFNGNMVRSYINGQQVDSTSRTGQIQTSNNPLRFARRGGAGYYNNWFDGILDDIGIWNRALTACEIQDLYNAELNSLAVNGGPDQELCKGQSTSLFGTGASTYSWSNNVQNGVGFVPTVTNTYILTGTDANGCVGTDTVIVTVNEVSSSTQTQTALDSYTWPVNGQMYTQSGTYTDTLTNAAGCDSIVTLNLTLSYTGIEELNPSVKKQLSKITDLNGKETPFRKNMILLFIYDDGTVKRVFEGE